MTATFEPLLPLPFQWTGAQWLSATSHGLLADEMGLGKTAQGVIASDLIRANFVLIVCPAVMRRTWEREWKRWSYRGLHVEVLTEVKDRPSQQAQVVICSYDYIMRNTQWPGDDRPELATHLHGPWDTIILDEAHYLKGGMEAKRSRAILGHYGVSRHSKRVWALTGTPAPSHVGELHPWLRVFGQTTLAYEPFVKRYCYTKEDPKYGLRIHGTRPQALPEIHRMLAPIMLRRLQEDVLLDLPPVHTEDVVVEPGEVDLSVSPSFCSYAFSGLEEEFRKTLYKELVELEEAVRLVGLGVKGIQYLETIAKGSETIRRYQALQTVQPMVEIIADELARNAYPKIIIFDYFKDSIARLQDELKDFGAAVIWGKTPDNKRDLHIRRFQEKDDYRVLILQIRAGGVGVTLTAANQVAFVGVPSFVPGDLEQAIRRSRRFGQKKPVFVRFFMLMDSYMTRISEIVARKAKDLVRVLDEREGSVNSTNEFAE